MPRVITVYQQYGSFASVRHDLLRLAAAEKKVAFYKKALETLADAAPGSYFHNERTAVFAKEALNRKFRTKTDPDATH